MKFNQIKGCWLHLLERLTQPPVASEPTTASDGNPICLRNALWTSKWTTVWWQSNLFDGNPICVRNTVLTSKSDIHCLMAIQLFDAIQFVWETSFQHQGLTSIVWWQMNLFDRNPLCLRNTLLTSKSDINCLFYGNPSHSLTSKSTPNWHWPSGAPRL